MLDLILYKINLFHPTITNLISLFFLFFALVLKVQYIHSFRDFLYYWFLRPAVTFTFSSIVYFFLRLSDIRIFDFSFMPFLFQVLVLYLLTDFCIYILHFLMHNNAFLFQLHKIHHQIKTLSWENGSKDTIWFEMILIVIMVVFSYSLHMSLPVIASTIFLWKLALAFTHFQKPIYSKWISFIVISPQKHELHHTEPNRDFFNYSLTLPIWDFIFKLFYMKLKKV